MIALHKCATFIMLLSFIPILAGIFFSAESSKLNNKTRTCFVWDVVITEKHSLMNIKWDVIVIGHGVGSISTGNARYLYNDVNTSADCWNYKKYPDTYSWENNYKLGIILTVTGGSIAILLFIYLLLSS